MDPAISPFSVHRTQRPLINRDPEYAEAMDIAPSFARHIPDEIILRVLSYLIPQRGVTISTDSAGDFDPLTIKSLLQTSRAVRNEVLSCTKASTLHIYIASGKNCPCPTLTTPDDILDTNLGKAAKLPTTIWGEIIVTFAPGLHRELGDACMFVQRTLRRIKVPYSNFASGTRCRSSITCVRRQSTALARAMGNADDVQENEKIRWKFVFDGSRGLDDRDKRHRASVHDLSTIDACLYPWRLQNTTVPHVTFPKRFRVGLDSYGGFFYFRLVDNDGNLRSWSEVVRERFEEEFSDRWNGLSPMLGRYIWTPDALERGELEDANPTAYWYTWPLRLTPHTMEDVEIRGGVFDTDNDEEDFLN
ncbi:uncharacterized protein Z520_08810 [Fonsecaea multimorphosa CBS 102226]|uniref:F-box domain-containing protein n=1 Tax=Fonsecaea multimorphosa CBS 102226 TaxID=1442371 RepID=A0A0D2KF12_9EURO|nr:uncharacterized protein Z520_08810 [Fonsecaea multimorphosa CBS 102226]KIX95293.1 hypothetical protein Z520_08810 [Fonsecaea multimorphosa CBS 102226]OAL21093.1 hypothetical protein AYO22_08250 [Fonsecaea multimorphosa]